MAANMSIWNHTPYQLDYLVPSTMNWTPLPIGQTIIAP